jgi:hypothetical protein
MTFNTQNFGSMMQRMSGHGEIQTSQDDPIFKALVRRKKQGEDTTLPPTQEYSNEDIEALESFCKQHGILGFNFGRMHPKAALSMLKNKMGMPSHTEVSLNQSKSLLKG